MRTLPLITTLTLACAVAVTMGCASKILKDVAPAIEPTGKYKIGVTSEPLPELSDAFNIAFQINFKNENGYWLRVDHATLDLSNADGSPYNIVLANDLVAWAEAKAEEKKIDAHNSNMKHGLANGLGTAAMLAGLLSNDKSLFQAGAVTTAAATSHKAFYDIQDAKNNAQGVAQVPNTYLYAPFTIPSMGLVKRWVLVNIPTGRIARTGILTLHTVEGEALKYKIQIARQ